MVLLCSFVLLQANPMIQEMVDSVSSDSILAHVQRLQDFVTRWSGHDSCYAAAEWIYDKFVSYGMDSIYHDTFTHIFPVPANIVGIKNGTVYPESCYTVICGHYDATTSNHDSAPGADDNASGVAAVLEAARILKDYQFEYNIRFIAFSAEEGGCVGSGYYVWRASLRGDDIPATFNFDMIGYVDIEPESIEVCGDTASEPLMDYFIACADTYTDLLTTKRLGLLLSDEWSFAGFGYNALGMIEDWPLNNPYQHTQADTIGAGFNDLDFCTEVTKAGIAALASISLPLGISESDKLVAQSSDFLMIFPNPFTNKTTITIHKSNPLMQNKYFNLSIYDASGCLVKIFLRSTPYALCPTHIDWSGNDDVGSPLPAGVYFLRATVGHNSTTKKLLLVR